MCLRSVCSSCGTWIEPNHLCIKEPAHDIDLCLCPECFDVVIEETLDRLGIYGSERRAVGAQQVLDYLQRQPTNRIDARTTVSTHG